MTIFRGVVTRVMGRQFVAEIENLSEPAHPREEVTLSLGSHLPRVGATFDWKIEDGGNVIYWHTTTPLTTEQIASAFAEADRISAILEAA